MTKYDFDTPIDRRGTSSTKFDCAQLFHRDPNLLSLWVADMDFRAPDEVVEALGRRVRHGIFGYTNPDDDYYDAVAGWMERRHGFRPEKSWFVLTPGVVFALAMAVRAFSEPGDGVLIQQPVYYPFRQVVERNARVVVNEPLVYDGSGYRMDFEALERAIRSQRPKLMLLCNPHNPVGRAWTRDELLRLGTLCVENDIVVVSDEIHADFARPGFSHCSFATLGRGLADRCVVCTSATKTFNLAGLQASNVFVPHPELRAALQREVAATGYGFPNVMGMIATQAACQHGDAWLDQLKGYLEQNWALLREHLGAKTPELKLVEAQSTYLAWIDCSALGTSGRDLARFIEDEAGLWLDCGYMFGHEGDEFVRINIATQQAYLEKALTQLTTAVVKRCR